MNAPLVALLVVLILALAWYLWVHKSGSGGSTPSSGGGIPSGGGGTPSGGGSGSNTTGTLSGSTSVNCPDGEYTFENHQSLGANESLLRFRASNNNALDVIHAPSGETWGATCIWPVSSGSSGHDINKSASFGYSSVLWNQPTVPHTLAFPLKS